MRNTDARVNKFIARQLNVLREYEETDKKIMYQNILIDNNPKAIVSGFRLQSISGYIRQISACYSRRGYERLSGTRERIFEIFFSDRRRNRPEKK